MLSQNRRPPARLDAQPEGLPASGAAALSLTQAPRPSAPLFGPRARKFLSYYRPHGALLAADKAPASALREAVTSPGGTTAAALSVLMADDGLIALMKRAVRAARERAEELS